ncbi:7117_t:CDS:2 [Dentiscutata heterogama]|uniref:7117_t:CDS:1 n=1 Tax=Dentiscutata heterogama TaxID=1316150 RepID=A0ACA9KK08_9GLOM|nr:7117_t:CDS:2 [Dentiscutata heterogama]
MYLYLALPHEWNNIKYKEPKNMNQIFNENIPQYFKEWTNYEKITNNLFQQQFLDKEIPNKYQTPYDDDKQEIIAEKPNYL